jgi:ATP-dependent DNA ligase
MWMKIKAYDTEDLFISGYEPAKIDTSTTDFDNWPYWKDVAGERKPVSKFYYFDWIGAIELSAYVKGKQMKICTCSGFDEALRKQISENPDAYLNKVIKVSFMERTDAGYPRHPRFEGFHESKTASECEWTFDE